MDEGFMVLPVMVLALMVLVPRVLALIQFEMNEI